VSSTGSTTTEPVAGETILVTGATGNQGGAVARRLLEGGWHVRALTRSPEGARARALQAGGAEIVSGDLDDPSSLGPALEGAYGVFSVQNFWEHGAERETEQGKALADAAAEVGVTHFVYSSVGGAERDSGLSHFESKWEIENHVRSRVLSATILRPAFLMENFNGPQYRGAVAGGTLAMGLEPGVKVQLVACDDIGSFAELAFREPDRFHGEALELAGDELTGPELADAFSRVLGRPVRFVPVPVERVKAMKAEVGEMFEWMNEAGYEADIPGLRELVPELVTFEEWLRRGGWAAA